MRGGCRQGFKREDGHRSAKGQRMSVSKVIFMMSARKAKGLRLRNEQGAFRKHKPTLGLPPFRVEFHA